MMMSRMMRMDESDDEDEEDDEDGFHLLRFWTTGNLNLWYVFDPI